MLTSSKINVQKIVNHSVALGLRHVVVSPGSRNAALIIAFNRHPKINCIVIPDERSAAFFALGMAQQTSELVGILCTSGSAPLNYYPAIAEAFYQRIPLVVFTADRPKAWINQGDGQTIVQEDLYKNHINYSVTFEDNIETQDYHWYIKRELSVAFHQAKGKSKGPIHINVAFTEPLYGQVEIKGEIEEEIITFENPKTNLSTQQEIFVEETWKKYSKKMIICGQMSPNLKLQAQLERLSEDHSVAILVENTSNLVHRNFNHCIDRSLNSISEDELENFSPDVLVYLGGAIVSKKIKAFLRKNKAAVHWKIGLDFPNMDTFQGLTHSFEIEARDFITFLNKIEKQTQANFGLKWKQLDYLAQEKAKVYFEKEAVFSDLSVFNKILDSIPESSNLHLANSSVIRYSLLFDPISSINYWCNRGTSGIDGSTSTAAGAAFLSKEKWNTLISGDMSFFYDSNAFWNHVLSPNLRIFLINNGGGSIFKIIPGPDSTEEQNDFFVYPNTFQAEYLCKNFNIGYLKANSIEEIDEQLHDFYTFEENGRPKVMEIFTSGIENEQILKDFFKKIIV